MSRSSPEAPLLGRRVLVTRPESRARGLCDRLAALGAHTDARPAIAVEPPADPHPARAAVAGLDAYHFVVFTSVNGVRFFATALARGGGGPDAVPTAVAIGPGTAEALRGAGLEPAWIADRSDSEGLARLLVDVVSPGERVLLVRPEVASDAVPRALASAGAQVDAVAFYRTVAAADAAAVASDVVAGVYHAVVFTSPSNLRCLVDAGGDAVLEALARTRRIAIGAVTGAALSGRDLAPHAVAATPDDDAIARAVVAALRAP